MAIIQSECLIELSSFNDLARYSCAFREYPQRIYSQELESPPKPKVESPPKVETQEEEVTPEQLSQVNDLEHQIDELENVLFSQLDPTSEGIPEQLSKIKELEKEIKILETVDFEHEIIQTLQNQNKKLDNIENKLPSSTAKK